MDAAGVDVAVVSLTCPNVFWGGREVSCAAAQLVNDDMAAAQREIDAKQVRSSFNDVFFDALEREMGK